MISFFNFLFCALLVVTATSAHAETKAVVTKTAEAKPKEGVSTDIDAKRLDDVMAWVDNSKLTLDTDSASIAQSPISSQEDLYADLVKRLLEKGHKSNEFLMRNVLYRVQLVYNHLLKVPHSAKRDAFARRILEEGLALAQSMYQPDKTLLELEKQKKLPPDLRGVRFADLGIKWADYMFNLYYLAPTNQSRLEIMSEMMGLMYNDVNNDDAVKRILAPISASFVVQYDKLKNLNPQTPVEKLFAARDMRHFMEQHMTATKNILETYNTNIQEKANLAIVTEQLTLLSLNGNAVISSETKILGSSCGSNSSWVGPGSNVTVLSSQHFEMENTKDTVKVRLEFNTEPKAESINAVVGCTGYIPITFLQSYNDSRIQTKATLTSETHLLGSNCGQFSNWAGPGSELTVLKSQLFTIDGFTETLKVQLQKNTSPKSETTAAPNGCWGYIPKNNIQIYK